MKKTSYLLVQNGSAEAEAAAEFAWALANETAAQLDVQHVIDTPAIWRFLAFNVPGFVGSGPFMEAQRRITDTLRSLAETVMVSYASRCDGKDTYSKCFIDEGDPLAEVCRRASDYDLVLIGQSNDISNAQTTSLIEKLEQECPTPLVIVQANTAEQNGRRQLSIVNAAANPEASEAVLELGRKLAEATPGYDLQEKLKYWCVG